VCVVDTGRMVSEQGRCNGRASVCLSVCLSVVRSPPLRVCCCVPGWQGISIDCCTAGAQQQRRRSTALGKRGQFHVHSGRRKRYRELLTDRRSVSAIGTAGGAVLLFPQRRSTSLSVETYYYIARLLFIHQLHYDLLTFVHNNDGLDIEITASSVYRLVTGRTGRVVSVFDRGVRGTKFESTADSCVYRDSSCDIQPWAQAPHLYCSA